MENALIESAIRGTVIAAGVSAVLWTARIKAPAVRHAAWTGVVIAMLVLPVWSLWGPKAAVQVLPAPAPSFAIAPQPVALAPIASGDRIAPEAVVQAAATGPSREPDGAWSWSTIGLVVYGLVAIALLGRLALGTFTTHRLRRSSVVRTGRLTSRACESPVTVGWLRPVVILPDRWEAWPPSQLDAVLTHEHAHVRRRDPLVQWLALLNRAIFWFVPVTWWLERRLSALAEQSCDDAVLARGHDPRDYSEYLLETARAVGRGARVNLAGVFMPGAFLPQRIRRILDGGSTPRVSSMRASGVAVACVTAAVFGAVTQPVRALRQETPSKIVVRPVQPRWVSPESLTPQPTSLEWLDGDEWAFEVQTIVTADELRQYSQLRTPPERDAFIARFWSRRDPTPGTPQNEFRDEFVRRVRFARERFGDPNSAGTLGFDTDRGRVYLMFGAPDAIETQAAGGSQEVWRYDSVPGVGSGVRVRFLPGRGPYCSYRIASPAPLATVEGVGSEAALHTSVQFHPHGLTTLSIPLDPATAIGVQWELRNRRGEQVDNGQIGFLEDGAPARPLRLDLPRAWFDDGAGCTHALPADSYTLTTAVRHSTGSMQRETVSFQIQ
jgi:GWxTD domain-containing protein